MFLQKDIEALDSQRSKLGFLSIHETVALADRGVTILDPFSTLISRPVKIGAGTILYPSLILECGEGGTLTIGNGNVFWPGVRLCAKPGSIAIGDGNEFGEGGFIARANREDSRIVIGSGGRYQAGASVSGASDLGSGSQILGPIAVDSCILGAGEPHTHPNPDRRGAVLKGQGRARNVRLAAGEVIFGNGVFSQDAVERQTAYHPPAPST
ncbi:hypothetical protein H2509_16245 [Stappia sp. F7233]|uniref:Uncharacterized protein n=1 Tax=Stappia albiluteola TaxID=2758565 RepID=A0A839AID2_9HYPH|nr:hypothetical protein [Stappia albiluteola]MBA5778682.1 hypothetical protein [Stappia albiluteola]